MEAIAKIETLLEEILSKQIRIVEDLLTTAYQETEALRTDDLARLSDLTIEQQLLAEKIQPLEEQRLTYLGMFKEARNLEEEPTLQVLKEDSEASVQLRETAQSLWDKFQQLGDQNELNGMLLNQSLHYTQKILGALNYGANYQPDGSLVQVKNYTSVINESV